MRNKKWQGLIGIDDFDAQQAMASLYVSEKDLNSYPINLSVHDAINKFSPRISNIKKYRGEEIQVAAILYLINFAASMLSVSNTIVPIQQQLLVKRIQTRYYFFNLAELRMCFIAGISGDYGKIYNRIDYEVVCEWLRLYDAQRASALEIKNLNNSNIKKTEKIEFNPDDDIEDSEKAKAKELFDLQMSRLKELRQTIQKRTQQAVQERIVYKSLHHYFVEIHIGFDAPPIQVSKNTPLYSMEVAKKYEKLIGDDALISAKQVMKVITAKSSSVQPKMINDKSEQNMMNVLVSNFIKTHLIALSTGQSDIYLTKIKF